MSIEIDDTPEKLRRNLLLISAISIVFWYLNLRLPEKVFEFKLPSEQHPKVWALMGVLELYTFFRFFHTSEAQRGRQLFAHFLSITKTGMYRTCLNISLWAARVLGSRVPFQPAFHENVLQGLAREDE